MQMHWKGIGDDTLQDLNLQTDNHGDIRATGHIWGDVEGRPSDVHYEICLDPNWHWKSFSIPERGDIICVANRSSAAYEAPYIDFILTPFTNTLPIRGESLAKGEKADIQVLYINYPELKLEVLPQRYERLSAHTYRFTHLSTGFCADIEVDEQGLVTRYPGLFIRQ